uniref:Uncharacterized protein n=1 Tax=Trichobilharzia regenti TaxID=157069 RepID=A0AA85KBE1_TRIRE|nr:unnamed protein product [Trichobilharzia regenti]
MVTNSSGMRIVLKAEMAKACISVMIAPLVNYFQEGGYTPSVLMKDNYAWRILRSGITEKYGLTDESDKKKAMLVTGHWVSKSVVFHMATKHRQLRHPIRPVKIIGYEQSLKTLDISKYFFYVPVGFTNTRIAYMIANRMVRSVCIPLFEDFSELIELQQLYCQIISDPFHYHIDAEYLTNSPKKKITDTSKNRFSRLTTYLNIFEPRSELLLYPQLCVNGKTREKYYFDYNDHLENTLSVIYTEIYMPSGNHLQDVLKDVCKISVKFPPEDNMLKDCWEKYVVDEKIQQSILHYYQSRSPRVPR